MLCKLCQLEKPLVEAHIVARCLFERLKLGGHVSMYPGERGVLPKRVPSGEYDTELLCAECDSSFSPWEEYAADLLHRNEYQLTAEDTKRRFYSQPYNYKSLKLCFLSILWGDDALEEMLTRQKTPQEWKTP